LEDVWIFLAIALAGRFLGVMRVVLSATPTCKLNDSSYSILSVSITHGLSDLHALYNSAYLPKECIKVAKTIVNAYRKDLVDVERRVGGHLSDARAMVTGFDLSHWR